MLLSLVGLTLPDAPAWAQFETRATQPVTYYGAFAIAAGDFNKDSKLDIVVSGDNGFTVSMGNGDGTFQPAMFYAAPTSYSLAVADVNGDGNLDIIAATEGAQPPAVNVYLGKGDGTFQPPIASSTTDPPYFVAVGDFNHDGKPDLAIIDGPYVSVLLGNGDGTFQPPSDNDSFDGAEWLAVGDFNNDHNLDVIVVGIFGSASSMGVFLGNGNGTLQESITTPLQYFPATVAVGYLRGSGNLDAVVGFDLNGMGVFLGNGDGTFQEGGLYQTGGIGNDVVLVDDLNLDGKLDVALPGGPAAGVDVFWGNGDGTFQPAQFFASGADSGLPAVGDLNGDHLPDFVLASELYTTTMLNTGTVSFAPSSPLSFPAQLINTSSPPQSTTLTNNGTKPLTIKSSKVSGQFKASDTCGSSLAVGASCTFSAVFQPTSAGTQYGLITITDSASSKPQYIELSGGATTIKASPSILKFKAQQVGTKSAPQIVTATNKGNTSAELSVYIGGNDKNDFAETDDCNGNSLAPGASCTISIIFSPKKTGALSGTLYLTLPLGQVSPLPVPLSGSGH